jgi:nucleotide-binding universal stress UspA family protein
VFKKILVGIDASAEVDHAFDDALAIAKATGATLDLLHVFSWDDAYDKCQAMLYSELEEIENKEPPIEHDPLVGCIISQYRGHQSSSALLKYKILAQKAGVQAEIAPPLRGRPGRSLCHIADLEKADLIVVGHRDKDWEKRLGMSELRLGSVSHEVIYYASCSVLIAHRSEGGGGALKGMSRILAALDGSEMSQVVFQESLDLAKVIDANLTLLHVSSPLEKGNLLETLVPLVDQAKGAGVPVSFEQIVLADNSTGQVICEFAQEQLFDLVLVGRRQMLERPAILLGGVSYYVAYHAPCGVIIVQTSH